MTDDFEDEVDLSDGELVGVLDATNSFEMTSHISMEASSKNILHIVLDRPLDEPLAEDQ